MYPKNSQDDANRCRLHIKCADDCGSFVRARCHDVLGSSELASKYYGQFLKQYTREKENPTSVKALLSETKNVITGKTVDATLVANRLSVLLWEAENFDKAEEITETYVTNSRSTTGIIQLSILLIVISQ
mmetsp:Transcript_10149/g.11725  ORF Transcript_10149/g.11725 Transcript_10149/m.11725 type:complete len:130 (-) Transcript_10149:166-555(-)